MHKRCDRCGFPQQAGVHRRGHKQLWYRVEIAGMLLVLAMMSFIVVLLILQATGYMPVRTRP